MINLESSQVYGESPYLNPPDHPFERYPDGFVCPYCLEEGVSDEGEVCPSCQADLAELRMSE